MRAIIEGLEDFGQSSGLPDKMRSSPRQGCERLSSSRAQDVRLASEVDDLDKVRQHFQLESTTLLGHSWGAVLAMEYAQRHPARVF